ncbi:riboflavin synthase [Sulfolobus acidocaldarius]|uniref:Riboflavin synthase n=4 Tax=Sulfolobus acidocaldarius TaxID=2285 RepID=Q4JAJ1_SULAC|nr:riboflavin synthase [Sulfolobus acidocaldarius]AAY80188.1 conserved Archaeal riboflavin synthase [Sulfolobus acidocaldarius DSM 639]AGE70767.1 riboflavin synthase [Sulfolobus acidocaldarius N8]AGE73038.1 riboflavin synthase [Sulfolobus acidocaldarius Ron12/I]ALU28907.1 riboflavin synthase [Sulfolobus acidocaldarius]ALU31632.1 riboflavin synthase [Sulfolobus acidocaldarius]
MRRKYGVADTTFSRIDMGAIAIKTITKEDPDAEIVRYTVPGIKDLPVAAKRLLDSGCDGVITLGWVGKSMLDKYSYLAASIGLITTQIITSKHVIDVTIHEDEAEDEEQLKNIAIDRVTKHSINLVKLIRDGKNSLTPFAGKGLRQGYGNAGPIED